jgi:uncharacterized coiled-coil protein SlyX
MALLAEILEQLLPKIGIQQGTDEFNLIVQNKGVAFEVPDKVKDALPTLLTIDEAKHNPTLKAHYYGNALDPFNKKVETWLKDNGVSDDDAKAISENKNTFDKIEKAIAAIAATKPQTKSNDAELKQKINELNQMLSQQQRERDEAVNSVRNEYEQRFTEQEIDAIIGSKPLPGQFDSEIERRIAREFLNKKLAEKNATVKRIDGKLKLVAKDDEKMFIFDAGKELDLDTLTNMALADNKFLKVNGNATQPQPKPTQGGQTPKLNNAANAALADLDKALEGFK